MRINRSLSKLSKFAEAVAFGSDHGFSNELDAARNRILARASYPFLKKLKTPLNQGIRRKPRIYLSGEWNQTAGTGGFI